MNTASPHVAVPTRIDRVILDAGGVIFPSAMPQILADLAADAGCDERALWDFFNAHLFDAFWSGRIDIPAFWTRMTAAAGVPGLPGRWQRELTTTMLTPLPHVPAIRAWARTVPVGILSNQRAEWLLPALDAAGLAGLFDPILISSRTGLVKPDPRALAQLTALGSSPDAVLYVDDRPSALTAAQALGVRTMRADPEGSWIAAVTRMLEGGRAPAATSPPRH